MEVTKIIVTINEVFNLGNYSSTKPSITIEANVHHGDNVDEVVSDLYSKAKAKIEAHIDEALLADDQAPKFYSGQRVDCYISNLLRLASIAFSGNDERVEFDEPMRRYGPRVWQNIMRRWPIRLAYKKIHKNTTPKHDSLPKSDYPFMILDYPFNDEALTIIAERKAAWLKQEIDRNEAARLAREQADQQWKANNPQPDTAEAEDEDDEDGDDWGEGNDNE